MKINYDNPLKNLPPINFENREFKYQERKNNAFKLRIDSLRNQYREEGEILKCIFYLSDRGNRIFARK